jgi:hypothetical protein
MYGLAYVILRRNFASLQEELDLSVAPFRRGGEERFPQNALAFDGATHDLKRLYEAAFEYKDGALAWDVETASLSLDLDFARVTEHLNALGFNGFRGTFAEIEPDFDRFVERFTRFDRRDSRTDQYGSWINPLGRWDWWELGGRFNGVITGEKLPSSDANGVSSGESAGRDTLCSVVEAFGGVTPGSQAGIEANVELAGTLFARLELGEENRLPTAVVLPHGSAPDAARWFDNLGWRETNPATFDVLAVPADTPFESLVRAAYLRFADHATAGVAYHF